MVPGPATIAGVIETSRTGRHRAASGEPGHARTTSAAGPAGTRNSAVVARVPLPGRPGSSTVDAAAPARRGTTAQVLARLHCALGVPACVASGRRRLGRAASMAAAQEIQAIALGRRERTTRCSGWAARTFAAECATPYTDGGRPANGGPSALAGGRVRTRSGRPRPAVPRLAVGGVPSTAARGVRDAAGLRRVRAVKASDLSTARRTVDPPTSTVFTAVPASISTSNDGEAGCRAGPRGRSAR